MTSVDVIRLLHFLSLFYMVFGLGGVIVPLYRGYRTADLDRRAQSFEDASAAHQTALVPGTIAAGATGIALAGDLGYNFLTTGWLLTLEGLYLFVLLLCLPLLGTGLRRVQIEALKAAKEGRMTPELEDALQDNVALGFSLIVAFSFVPMVYLPVFRPY